MRRSTAGAADLIVAALVVAFLVAAMIPPPKLSAAETKLALARELPTGERAIRCLRLPDEGQVDVRGVAQWSGFDYECLVFGHDYGRDVFVEVDGDSIVEITGV